MTVSDCSGYNSVVAIDSDPHNSGPLGADPLDTDPLDAGPLDTGPLDELPSRPASGRPGGGEARRPRTTHMVELPAAGLVCWAAWFGNDHPVELEIGCGKGAFLLRRARAVPEHNFLGIEWANEYYRFAADRMARWGLDNVRLLRTDAGRFMIERCPRSSLAALHIYHPDPWPKRRHQRRRLFQPALVAAAIDCLRPGGRWAVQTDHAEYFSVIRELLGSRPELEPVAFDEPGSGVEAGGVATNFEIKYRRAGRAIYQLAFRRRPPSR